MVRYKSYLLLHKLGIEPMNDEDVTFFKAGIKNIRKKYETDR